MLHGGLVFRFQRRLEPFRTGIGDFGTRRFGLSDERAVRGERLDRVVPRGDDVGRQLRRTDDPVPADQLTCVLSAAADASAKIVVQAEPHQVKIRLAKMRRE